MRQYIYVLIIVLSSLNLFSQGQANIWYFGENAGLDFNDCSPISINGGQINTREGCSSFSDASGNLLFYSDGTNVWNKNHSILSGGSGLAGNASSSQSAMIIPQPTSTTLYYIFTVGDAGNPGFNYYTLDMDAASGLGAIVDGPIDLSEGRTADWTEKVAAVKGAEAGTFWVVSYVQNEFYSYKVSLSGVANTPVKSEVSFSPTDKRGYLKLSPDGRKLAIAHMADATFIIYDFDDSTGKVSNQRTLPLPAGVDKPYGVEFSADSNKLYVHASNDGNATNDDASSHVSTLYQFDVTSPDRNDIINSRVLLDSRNLFRGALQLGPDRKIYRALSQSYNVGKSFLGVINQPEEDGEDCDYQHNGISLGGNKSTQGLPPFIASIFSQIQVTAENSSGLPMILNDVITNVCIGEDFEIFPESLDGSATYSWYFDRNIISTDSSLLLNNVSSSINGDYRLLVEFTDACGLSSSLEAEFTIFVRSSPIGVSSVSLNNCDADGVLDGETNFNLDLANDDITNSDFGFDVTFYKTASDANTETSPIINRDSFHSSEANPVFARAVDIYGCGSYVTQVDLTVSTTRFPTDYVYTLAECDGDEIDGVAEFNLLGATNDILSLFPSEPNLLVLYYRTLEDANLARNPIFPYTEYENETPFNQEIFVGLRNAAGDCFGIGPYVNLVVNPRPEFEVDSEIIFCKVLSSTITLETYNAQGDYNYRWINEEGTTISTDSFAEVDSGGIYTVIGATDLGCEYQLEVIVNEFTALELNREDVEIIDDSDNNTIMINGDETGFGDGGYQFSLDNELGPYQDSLVFENVLPGAHTLYAYAKNGCGISQLEVFVIGFPNFFTPNNDGYNDSWGILGLDNELYSTSIIQIFDRFGKIVANLDSNIGWDGIYNGVELPASDYWYSIQLIDDEGNIRDKKGHFSLIRR